MITVRIVLAILCITITPPSYAAQSADPKQKTKVFLACIPKSGTHLLSKLISMMGFGHLALPGSLVEPTVNNPAPRARSGWLTHALYSPALAVKLAENNYKIISLIRDPRDQAVSFVYFAHKNKDAWPEISGVSFDEGLTRWIQKTSILNSEKWGRFRGEILRSLNGIDDFYAHYLEWAQCPDVYVTRFELLVGSQGGGSDEAQRQEILNIAAHLGITLSSEKVDEITRTLFGQSRTFRNGQIGSWKTHFKQSHVDLFKHIAGQLLIDLGYEKDFDWDIAKPEASLNS